MYRLGIETNQDFNKAFKLYVGSANQGNADAQYWVGLLYKVGKGTFASYKNLLNGLKNRLIKEILNQLNNLQVHIILLGV